MKNKQRQQAKLTTNKSIEAISIIDDIDLQAYSNQKPECLQIGSADFKQKIRKTNKRHWD